MIDETKKRLESRMLRKLHVRFGVGVKVQSLGLHHVRVEPRSKNAIAAGNSSFEAGKGKTNINSATTLYVDSFARLFMSTLLVGYFLDHSAVSSDANNSSRV